MSTDTVLTDEQIDAIRASPGDMRWVIATKKERYVLFARAIEQAVLQSPEVLALRQRVEDMEKIVAECRDAMPIPNVGSKAEILWPDAMSDAAAVPDFIKASIESMKKDAERYRWLREQPNDTEAPRIDVVYWVPSYDVNEGEGMRFEALDAAIDAAMEKQP